MNQLLNDYISNLLPHPELVKLFVRLSPKATHIMLFNPFEEQSLAHFTLNNESDSSGDSRQYLKSLEKSIYNHPGLIEKQWSSITILIDYTRFALFPAELPNPYQLFQATYGDASPGSALLVSKFASPEVNVVCEIDSALLNFLRRTFVNADILPAIMPMATYCVSKCNTAAPVITTNFSALGSVEIITAAGGRLLQASRFEAATPDDAAFFTLSASSVLSEAPGEIYITGTSPQRNELMATLRRFHGYVMPLIFPAEMHRAGAEVGTIEFDLLISPLISPQPSNPS